MAEKITVNGSVLNLLKQLGLNQYESKIYLTLMASGSLTAGDLSESSDVPRSRVYDVLSSLEKKGFAIVQVGRPVKYVAVPVESAISEVKTNYESEFAKKLSYIAKIEKDLKSAISSHVEKSKKQPENLEEVVGILRGNNNIYKHIKHLIASSNKKILKITNDAGLAYLEKTCIPALERAKRKGIKVNVLANLTDTKNVSKVSELINLRNHKGIDGHFFISDSNDIVLMTNPGETGIWIKSPYLANSLEKLFEHAWDNGKSLSE